MKKSFGCLVGIAASLILTVTSAQAEIKIGIAGPLSGSALSIGEQQEVGAYKAVSDLNGDGGVLGQMIVATSVDDACEPEQAKAAARQLISEGVIVVIGHMCSATSIAVSEIYEEAGIIMISPASTNPTVTEQGHKHVFRVAGRDDQQGAIAGDYLVDNHAQNKIAILHDGQAYGLGLAEFTKQQLNKRGVSEAVFDGFTADQTDYQSIVDKLAAAKIDVLYVGGYQGDVGIIVRQAKTVIPNLQVYAGDALAKAEFMVVAGSAGEGTQFTFGPDMRVKPEAAKVAAAIRKDEDYEPEGYTLYSYGAVQAWAQAVQQAGSLKPEAVIGTLKTGSFNTVLGKIGFDDKGDVTGISAFIWYKFGKEEYFPAE